MSGHKTPLTRRNFVRHAGAAAAATSFTQWTPAAEAATPDVVGRWSAKYPWPDVAIHHHLLPSSTPQNARLLSFSDDDVPGLKDRNAGFSKSYIVNIPAGGTPSTSWLYVANNDTNLFCSGHTFLPDGRLLAMGGQPTSTTTAGRHQLLRREGRTLGWQTPASTP